jgi:hypothetical protein
VLHELVRRTVQRGGTADLRLAFCVTATELADFVARPNDFADVISERAKLQRYLDERIPPPWFEGHIPDPATWTVRADARPQAPAAGTTVTGIAVSGGTASGPARVVVDPADPRVSNPVTCSCAPSPIPHGHRSS